MVVDPGTDNNSGERLGERYTWERDKYELWANEVAGVGACVITFDFKPVPKIGNDLRVTCNGYYTGNHASPQAPKFQVYDQVGTDWEDITGMLFSTGGSEYELLEGVIPYDTKYFGTGDNVRIRILHPVIGGNPTHEFHINEVKLGTMPVTTTTSTSTTSTTTTAP